MVKRLTKLTKAQKDRIPSWNEEWIAKGLKTGEADWDRFERGIRKLYNLSGLDGDNLEIIRTQSPLEAVTEGPLKAAKLEGKPKKQHKAFIKNEWHKYIGGQAWIGWAAYTKFYTDVCKLELPKDLKEKQDAYVDILESAWWCWPHEKFVTVSNRPVAVHLDPTDPNRLHCENDMAIKWPDGFGMYVWKGISVPEKLIMKPESYTADEIRKINNTEIVRALAERLGWDKYLDKLGVKVIDSWTDPNTNLQYELLESKRRFGDMEPRFIRKQSSELKDKSQPWYIEPVHAGLDTAAAARKFQAMAAYMDANADETEYDQLMEYCNDNPELEYDWER